MDIGDDIEYLLIWKVKILSISQALYLNQSVLGI